MYGMMPATKTTSTTYHLTRSPLLTFTIIFTFLVKDVTATNPGSKGTKYKVHLKKMAETHRVPCVEETWVSLGLFSDVSNASWLRGEATGGRLEAALLDPSLVR